ncbi:MAG: hypothetical protein WC802_00330 [Patescibacteria group bacterium]
MPEQASHGLRRQDLASGALNGVLALPAMLAKNLLIIEELSAPAIWHSLKISLPLATAQFILGLYYLKVVEARIEGRYKGYWPRLILISLFYAVYHTIAFVLVCALQGDSDLISTYGVLVTFLSSLCFAEPVKRLARHFRTKDEYNDS